MERQWSTRRSTARLSPTLPVATPEVVAGLAYGYVRGCPLSCLCYTRVCHRPCLWLYPMFSPALPVTTSEVVTGLAMATPEVVTSLAYGYP